MKLDIEKNKKSGRENLLSLEKTGKYLFHGSGQKINILETRQAYNYPNNEIKNRIPDGVPAVFASDIVDIPIFMAIINNQNAPEGARSGFSGNSKDGFEFRATKSTFDQIKNAKGYVYVFDKNLFRKREGRANEYISILPVEPLEIIEVTEKDLPESIVVKDF